MKNLFFVALFALLTFSCQDQSNELVKSIYEDHPEYVQNAVKDHLAADLHEKFLASIVYGHLNHIVDMDVELLDTYVPKDELYTFGRALLGIDFVLLDKEETGLESRTDGRCFTLVSLPEYDNVFPPRHPRGACIYIGRSKCITWGWVC